MNRTIKRILCVFLLCCICLLTFLLFELVVPLESGGVWGTQFMSEEETAQILCKTVNMDMSQLTSCLEYEQGSLRAFLIKGKDANWCVTFVKSKYFNLFWLSSVVDIQDYPSTFGQRVQDQVCIVEVTESNITTYDWKLA